MRLILTFASLDLVCWAMYHILSIVLKLLRNCQGIVEVVEADEVFKVDPFELIALHPRALIHRAHFVQ